jgi:hypothetical protein
VADIRQHAASRCLLGAVETVSHDPGCQAQLIAALRDAIELRCGRPLTIVAYTAAAAHSEVLAVIDDAIDLTATRTWGTPSYLQLPTGPPSDQEAEQLAFEHQCLCELFFASDLHAGQYNATPTLRAGARADTDAIAAYLDAHEAWPRLCAVDHDDAPVNDSGDLDLPF